MSRAYDVVVLGATGYSGRLVCEHLRKAASGTSWAIAGRDVNKLSKLAADLKLDAAVGKIVADTSNTEALDAMCQKTTVVIACAGPFDLVGMKVVESCIRNGTHYCDITGEFTFVRKVIERYEAAAIDKKVMIVPCCGFDCIPSDVGNWLVHTAAAQAGLGPVTKVTGYFNSSGSPSGGTMASVANLFASMEKKDFHPSSLSPRPAPGAVKVLTPHVKGISFCSALKKYQGPYFMAAINERVVRRSNALSNRGCAYVEAAVGSLTTVLITTISMYLFGVMMVVPIIRQLLCKYVFPSQGSGPSDEQRSKGKIRAVFVGETDLKRVEVTLRDERDPYTATGVFAATSGLVAADLAKRGKVPCGGVLTASVAFGQDLYDKLRNEGVTFDVKITSDSDDKKRQ